MPPRSADGVRRVGTGADRLERVRVPSFVALRQVLQAARAAAPGGLPPAPLLPELDPWSTWLLLGLCRHQRRQAFVGQVVRERLGLPLEALGSAPRPPGLPPRGAVPGLPHYEYELHGIGCRLVDLRDGSVVDVDFPQGQTRHLDPWFYAQYLGSLRAPARVERQLIRPPPCAAAWELELGRLRELGLMQGATLTAVGWRLGRPLRALADRLEEVEACPAPPVAAEAAWLTAGLGDARLALELLPPDPAQAPARAALEARAREQRAARRASLRRLIQAGDAATGLALQGLAELGPAEAREEVCAGLRRRPAPPRLAHAALELVAAWSREADLPLVLELLAGLEGHPREVAQLGARAGRWLLSVLEPDGPRLVRRRLLQALRRALLLSAPETGPARAELALLLALVEPDEGLPHLEGCLQAGAPHLRRAATAALAALGTPAARGLLPGALEQAGFAPGELERLQAEWSPLVGRWAPGTLSPAGRSPAPRAPPR